MTPFIVLTFGISWGCTWLLMAVAYNKTNSYLLFPILLHWLLIIAFWPDAQPWENYLNLALAIVLLWMHRDVMFSNDKGFTTVVPD